MVDIPDKNEDVEEFSPYKLLDNFSKSRILPCLFLALVLHVLVIGGTSYNFIYRTWIDPNPESADANAAEQPGEASETPSEGEASKQGTKPGETAEEGGEDKAATEKTGEETPKKPADGDEPPVIKKITEEPKPGEIPDEPDSLGISLEDTNR